MRFKHQSGEWQFETGYPKLHSDNRGGLNEKSPVSCLECENMLDEVLSAFCGLVDLHNILQMYHTFRSFSLDVCLFSKEKTENVKYVTAGLRDALIGTLLGHL